MKMPRFLCRILGHPSYMIVKRLGAASWCLQCSRCGRFFGVNTDARVFLPWDLELTAIHDFNPWRIK